MHYRFEKAVASAVAAAITLLPIYPAFANDRDDSKTKTPIKHVVVIFPGKRFVRPLLRDVSSCL